MKCKQLLVIITELSETFFYADIIVILFQTKDILTYFFRLVGCRTKLLFYISPEKAKSANRDDVVATISRSL